MSVITTNTKNSISKVEALANAIGRSCRGGNLIPVAARHGVSVAELQTMMDLSMNCNHTARKNSNVFGFERTPEDRGTIPSIIEDMKLPFNANLNAHTNVRKNAVICGFVAVSMAMSELGQRVAYSPNQTHHLVVTSVVSVKQMGMIKMLYEIMQMGQFSNANVKLHAFMDERTRRDANAFLTPNANVHLWNNEETGWAELVERTRIERKSGSVTLTGYVSSVQSVLPYVMNYAVQYLSVIADANDIAQLGELSYAAAQANCIMETVPLSDPQANVLRLTNALVCEGETPYRTVSPPHYWLIGSFISWHTSVIRPMNLGGMCYDCRIAFMLASNMAAACGCANVDTSVELTEAWSAGFARTVSATDITDKDP